MKSSHTVVAAATTTAVGLYREQLPLQPSRKAHDPGVDPGEIVGGGKHGQRRDEHAGQVGEITSVTEISVAQGMDAVPQDGKHHGDVHGVDAKGQVADVLADGPMEGLPQRGPWVELEGVQDHECTGPGPEDVPAVRVPPGGIEGDEEAPGEGAPDAEGVAVVGLAEDDDPDHEEDQVADFGEEDRVLRLPSAHPIHGRWQLN